MKKRLKNVLITGGCGFIGTNLVICLVAKGYKIRILDNFTTNSSIWLDKNNNTATNHQINILNELTENSSRKLVSGVAFEQAKSNVEVLEGDIRDKEVVEKAKR